MKLNKKLLMNGDTYRKMLWGKVINFKMRKTVGFASKDIVDTYITTYLFGFKIKQIQSCNQIVTKPELLVEIRKNTTPDEVNSDRVYVRGFSKKG
jgi:hypothetical protein